MKRKTSRIVLSTTIICILAMTVALAAPGPQASGVAQEEQLPVLNGIVLPRIGYPSFIAPDGDFEAKLVLTPKVESAGSWEAFLVNEVVRAPLKLLGTSADTARRSISLRLLAEGVPPGLYDLEVTARAPDGSQLALRREPSSVSVRASLDLPFKIMWIADTHVDDTPTQQLNFQRIVRLANFLAPDAVLIAGDVIQNPRESFFALGYRLMRGLEVPVILAPGNHDHATEGNFFEKYLAPWNGSVTIGPVHIATLDTGPGSIEGSLSQTQLEWLDRDLQEHHRARFKILMWHHPMFDPDDPRNETAKAVYPIAVRHGVNLILNGHMHRDIIFRGPVLTLINSNAYPGGRPFTGFRMLTITEQGIDYRYAGTEEMIPLYDLNVTFYQVNDGAAYGSKVDVENKWRIPVDGKITIRVKHGQQLRVTGLESYHVTNTSAYAIVRGKATVAQGVSLSVSAYTQSISAPPQITLAWQPEVVEGPTANFILFGFKVQHDGLGVREAELYYSTDNRTWYRSELLHLEPRIFSTRIQVEKSVERVWFYATSSEIEGRVAASPRLVVALVQEMPAAAPAPAIPLEWLVAGLMVMGATVAAYFARRQRARAKA